MPLRFTLGAPSKQEAQLLSKTLVEQKLVAGTIISEGCCHYWWEDKIVEKQYRNIEGFTQEKNKQDIIEHVESIHSDKCPIIAFYEVDTNKKCLERIQTSTE